MMSTAASERRRPSSQGFVRPVVLAVLAGLVLVGGRLVSDSLPSWLSVQTLLTLSMFIITIALGQGLVMLIGGLDLSVPGVIAMSAAILALWTSVRGGSVIVGILIALVMAVLVGVVNGFLVARFQIPAFIITLAMNGILVGISIGITFGHKAPAAPEVVTTLFSGSGKWFGIGIPVFFFVLVALVGYVIQAKSRFGRGAYLFGSSNTAARIAGLPVERIQIGIYALCALGSGIAGIMLLGLSGNAELQLGDEWAIPAISAVLVGGTVIGSGRGYWQSTVAACLLLTSITVVIQATGFSQGWKSVLYGVVVLIALLFTRPDTRFSLRRKGSPALAEGESPTEMKGKV